MADTPTAPSKSLFTSKVFWFNVVTVLVYVASGKVTGVTLPPDIAMTIVTLGNIALRLFFTTAPAHIIPE